MLSPTTRGVLVQPIQCAILILGLGALAVLSNNAFLAPPLGASAFSVVRAPHHPDNQPRHLIVSHVIGMGAGLLALQLCGVADAPGALSGPFTWCHAFSGSLAVMLTSAIGFAMRATHPPSLATTLVASLGLLTRPLAAWSLLGGAALLAIYVAFASRSAPDTKR